MSKIVVKLRGETSIIEAEEGKILLDVLLESGIKYPHGCRAGSCGACRSIVLEGNSDLSDPSTIERITLEGVMLSHPEPLPENSTPRLACRSIIQGPGPIKITPL